MAVGNNISFKELAKRKTIDPVVNLLTGLQQGYTKNTQQEPTGTIQQLGRFAGGLTRGGSDVTGKLAEFATRPETLEVASRIGQLATAYEDPQISNVLGQIAGDIGSKRALKEQRDAAKILKQQENILKKQEDRRKNINELVVNIPKDEQISRSRQALASGMNIRKLIESDTPLTPQALRTQIPRLMGEVGNLTEQEQAAWTGDPRIVEKFKRAYAKNIATGKLTESDKKLFIDLLDTLENAHRDKIQQTLTGVVDSAVLANPDYYTKTELYQILEPRILSPKKIEPQQTQQAPQQAQQQVTDYSGISDEELMRGL